MKVKASNEVTLEFPSRSSNEGFARAAVACFAAQMDPTLNELEDIKTSVSEAVTNAIVHAYPDSVGKIYIWTGIYENGKIKIDIAFIAAPSADAEGNANGIYGKSACGSMGYAVSDAKFAKKTVIITCTRSSALLARRQRMSHCSAMSSQL